MGGPDGPGIQFAISVDDIDATGAEPTPLVVELLNGPVNRPWGIHMASFRDLAAMCGRLHAKSAANRSHWIY